MNRVVPQINLQDNILFNEIDLKDTKIFLMQGLGTTLPQRVIMREGSNPSIQIHDYNSKGITADMMTLLNDLKTETVKTRSDRLKQLITSIKSAINIYSKVILIGCSHGSLIMYSALVEVEADPSVHFDHLKKLYFYAVTPPKFFPSNTLSYNVTDTPNQQTSPTTSQKIITIQKSPPFAHVHYELDPFFNKGVKFDSTVVNWIYTFAKAKVLKEVSGYFDRIKTKINAIPENKCFYWDESRKVVFTKPFPMLKVNDDITKTIDNYFCGLPIKNVIHYRAAFQHLINKRHADPLLLYPFMNYIGIRQFLFMYYGGGNVDYITILGKKRKVIRKGRWSYIKYKGSLITLETVKKLAASVTK